MPKTFAEALQTQLEKAGITPYRLHQLTGLSVSTISRFLNEGMQPGWDSVQKIAKALGVSCEVFAIEVDLPEAPDERGRGRPKDEEAEESEPEKPKKASKNPKGKK